ncbi:unnamed protein product [Tilletia controversa]|uniref:Uncharacterized protein n=3 Tax=Tilletia TaxID=13289 RepID=A0A8X7SZL3_9BASI|nr:hypothetical protein CF336_g681 [Tilletia laevis]KAE8204287.1 hypothetical protein CF328_g1167 [Tilletia controversa]KAE8265255.1 hypothetical protein A4X03_0g383 [Tilletia caries]KAE8208581.1 hypothetical protein CF335_g307 [Tilletia laevis]KAE8253184.1 hypothetical protein A4X06_0g1633 [Tilletia controversa]
MPIRRQSSNSNLPDPKSADQSLNARQGLLVPAEDTTGLAQPPPPPLPVPENAGQILSSLQVQNSPTSILLPTDLLSQLISGPTPVPTLSSPTSVSASHHSTSHKSESAVHTGSRSKDGADDGPVPFKIVYLTPLFILVGLFLIFSVGGKIWGSAWRSKQRELRRRRKHRQNLEKDTEHQALDPDASADGPHAHNSDDEDHHNILPHRKRLQYKRSEQHLVPDDGTTGVLHAFGARILGTKGTLIPPTTRDRAGNKYSMPVQSNGWWKVHMNRAMSKADLEDDDDEDDDDDDHDFKSGPMAESSLGLIVTVARRATVTSATSPFVQSPPGSRPGSPSKLSRAGSTYRPDSPTRQSKPGTSYFPYTEGDAQSIIVHSPPASPTKEDEPMRWQCRSAISSTTRGTSVSRSDSMSTDNSRQSPSRKATQRRNAGRRQDSVVEIETIAEPAPARLPTELRIGVNTSVMNPLDKSSAPSSPIKRHFDQSLFLASPTAESYGLQPALKLKKAASTSSSPSASRTNSERSARSAVTTTSEGQSSVTTSSSKRSESPQRRAALARRSPNKLRSPARPMGREGSETGTGDEDVEEDDEAKLLRALTSPPLRARGRTQEGPFADSTDNSPRRARTADNPAFAGKKLRTPAEKTRERMLALQSAQSLIDEGLSTRAADP